MTTKRIEVETSWDPDTKMELYMVDTMLDGTIGKTGKVRAAVKEWCVGELKQLSNDHSLTLGEMELEALAFSSGYEAGLKAQ